MPTEGETLSVVTSSIQDEDGGIGDPYHYRWKRDGVTIVASADQDTYTLVQDDVGSTISVEVSYEDAHENSEVLVFAATASIANTNDVAQGNIDTRPVILVLNRSVSRIEMTGVLARNFGP